MCNNIDILYLFGIREARGTIWQWSEVIKLSWEGMRESERGWEGVRGSEGGDYHGQMAPSHSLSFPLKGIKWPQTTLMLLSWHPWLWNGVRDGSCGHNYFPPLTPSHSSSPPLTTFYSISLPHTPSHSLSFPLKDLKWPQSTSKLLCWLPWL